MTDDRIPMWHYSEDRDHGAPPDYYTTEAELNADDRRESECPQCDNSGACNGGPCPLLDRRERYAAAIHSELSHCEHYALGNMCAELADAAMAVADAENREYRDAARDAHKLAHRRMVDTQREAYEAAQDNARLRDDLAEAQRGTRTMEGVADSAIAERNTADATIERVRAVLDSDPGWTIPELRRRVRTALEGLRK